MAVARLVSVIRMGSHAVPDAAVDRRAISRRLSTTVREKNR
jgi:hypothetical protein